MQQCYFCKGPLRVSHVRHVHTWKGEMYIFEDVPAEVCQQCGEVFFSPEVLEKMDQVTSGELEADSMRSVPVYVFEALAS